jgi:glutamate-5-semialdehyde dehydrogenase
MSAADMNSDQSLPAIMAELGRNARLGARALKIATATQKRTALLTAAGAINAHRKAILKANALDMATAQEKGISGAFLDRLLLNDARIDGIIEAVKTIAELPDPVGTVISEWDRPNGLHIERVRTPLGVIGVIFESRPNVTADAGALCIKAGNAVILRGGSDSFHSSRALVDCLLDGLHLAGLPVECVQLVPTTDRAAVGEMLKGLDGNIDVIVPRGGKSLVARVQSEARVPVFSHLEGLVHVYVDKSAELEKAVAITTNAKMRRTGICGAAETLLIHKDVVETHLKPIIATLVEKGCEIRGDAQVMALIPDAIAATEQDWKTEYEDAIISVKVIDSVEAAIAHIEHYSSHHTEAIIAEDAETVEKFFNEIDSAVIMHNASTQFSDGGEFGFGGEIGIATGKMHARGPVGVEQLTSFKYRVRGSGQLRP